MKFIIAILVITFKVVAADFGTGVGSSAATDGRIVPALSVDMSTNSFMVSAMSTGVKTTAYSHNFYEFGLFRTVMKEQFFGEVTTGFGIGGYHTRRKLDQVGVKRSGTIGPAFRMNWRIWGPLFIGLEAMLGINFNHPYLLPTSDAGYLVIGVRTY